MLTPRSVIATLCLAGSATALTAQVVLMPTHYDAAFVVDYDAERLSGNVRITLRNPGATPVREASLLLYRLLQVRSVRDGRGTPLRYAQSVVAFDDFAKLQVNHVLVTLAQPLAAGEQSVVEVQYDGHLLGYAETGMRYIQDRIDTAFTILRDDSYAYPQPGFPSYRINRSSPTREFTYAVRTSVPKGLVVANGGRLDRVDTAGNTVTFSHSSLRPSWRMDFAIGRFTEQSSASVRVFHLPGDSAGAARVLVAAGDAMSLFTRWFGPRPAPTLLTFIEIPDGWGSQADVTTVLQSAAAFRSPRAQGEVYHEISHLWGVSAAERPSPRWEEGLASFLEDLVTEDVAGKQVTGARADQLVTWLRGQLPARAAWRATPLIDYGRSGMTDLSYSVGALYFHLVYRLAGREAFNRIIGEFSARFASGGGTTRDLANLVKQGAAVDLGPLNDDWLFTTGWAARVANATTIADLEAYYRRPRGR